MRLIDADALWMEIIHRIDHCNDTLDIIEEMPTVSQWIPCSERLPEIGKKVLLSEPNDMFLAEYYGDGNPEGVWHIGYIDGIHHYLQDIKGCAWVPLPEPYKGETKAKEEIQKNCIGHVYTTQEFIDCVRRGSIISDDGTGYFHDGENETFVSVWKCNLNKAKEKYPYVCWYNK